mmetsp:Transcript_19873/g.55413  ORF Transcript_19873/g.55413 Transcript_19873/m.55413 type:complete len:319 (+) Transcript_19873:132-1088(+)
MPCRELRRWAGEVDMRRCTCMGLPPMMMLVGSLGGRGAQGTRVSGGAPWACCASNHAVARANSSARSAASFMRPTLLLVRTLASLGQEAPPGAVQRSNCSSKWKSSLFFSCSEGTRTYCQSKACGYRNLICWMYSTLKLRLVTDSTIGANVVAVIFSALLFSNPRPECISSNTACKRCRCSGKPLGVGCFLGLPIGGAPVAWLSALRFLEAGEVFGEPGATLGVGEDTGGGSGREPPAASSMAAPLERLFMLKCQAEPLLALLSCSSDCDTNSLADNPQQKGMLQCVFQICVLSPSVGSLLGASLAPRRMYHLKTQES